VVETEFSSLVSTCLMHLDTPIQPRFNLARDLLSSIDEVSTARYNFLHETTHLALGYYDSLDVTGPLVFTQFKYQGADSSCVNDWFKLPPAEVTPVGTTLPSLFDGASSNLGAYCVMPPAEAVDQALSLLRVDEPPVTLRRPLLWVLVRAEHRQAFVRFLDGILAALRYMLGRVLAAISRQPAALAFVLVVLATCLRYGRRSDTDDHAFLPTRRYQTSLGSCLNR